MAAASMVPLGWLVTSGYSWPSAGFLGTAGLWRSSPVPASSKSPLLLETKWYGAQFIPLPWTFTEHWTLERRVSEDHQPHTVAPRPCRLRSLARGVYGGTGKTLSKRPFSSRDFPLPFSPSICLRPNAGQTHVLSLKSLGYYANHRMDIFLSVHKYSLPVRNLAFPEHTTTLVNIMVYLHGCLSEFNLTHMKTLIWSSNRRWVPQGQEIMSILSVWLNI